MYAASDETSAKPMFFSGVMSALITLDDFQRIIPLMTPRETANTLCWIGGDVSSV